MAAPSVPPAIPHMASHILSHLPATRFSPLLVGIQGPQGSGKTFLTSALRTHLSSPPHSLSVSVLSIDDLYLPHEGLKRVAEESSENRLLQGRGLPGTHDVALGTEVLQGLREGREVVLPVFEKSLFEGEGDRLSDGITVSPPLDVVLLEGWFVGFGPLTDGELERRWDGAPMEIERGEGDVLDLRAFVRREDIVDVNERLKAYVGWWELLDVFIQARALTIPKLTPRPSRPVSPHSLIYKWRLEQEHNMKAKNGGKGMSDEAVKAFVDRYIPGYVFFSNGVTEGYTNSNGNAVEPKWKGKGLRVLIGEEREVVGTEQF
ncbi:P-loop containing nucleoside triphosphate hydrolase protein [Neolentinus lepideus HHB14362 ss-1]|uniref:p-loop containing nucleoside triphosphate hydrolase protein n=1 Tax=Neolentinus lepideus HHB14362 ss-1 TaxID=1314782 RepID=A0A165R9V5_9AGAM|nr:P-loop containing nucleoside triphosphate hydrolase protein [Neolentinus lepideus HHB14362 ss-1]